MVPFDHREQVLTATWTPQDGVRVTFSDLPDPWLISLDRLGRDLKVRQYGGDVERIDWVAEYDPEGGWVWLLSSVTIAGHRPSGLGVSGMGASVDDDEEKVLMSMADLVQNEVAESGTAWPWGDAVTAQSLLLQ
ncbi:hypothetical protein [Rhodococcus maanshanensis]|uniref:hypothetical protein n=1 Tax=Rhodococcus maanshanensis TaxID=183556 RepID=UPI001160A0BF|nr:hypothetical protein [Rhodococcus maanshanensis]